MGISFHRGACGVCVSIAKWLPVLFITAVVGWSYFAYVYHLCFLTIAVVDGWFLTIFLLIPYHVLLALFVWSYWNTVFTPPGNVPKRFGLSVAEMDMVEASTDPRMTLDQLVVSKDLPVVMRSIQGEVRYCSECSQVKPDRAHHCSVCGQCVLKMDHHCPWVNNCVAFANYKFFILFLGYAVLYCLYVALSTLKYFLLYWTSTPSTQSAKFQILFLFFVSGMFCISVMSLFGYHLYLVARNQTTLESFRAPIFRPNLVQDKRGFHLGTYNNMQEVFGDKRWLWFIPIQTYLGDGIVFPQRGSYLDSDEEMGCTDGAGAIGYTACSQSVGSHSLMNGVSPRQHLRQHSHQHHSHINSANRNLRPRGTEEELVPMINATNFDDEESEDEFCWTDETNQRTKLAQKHNSSRTSYLRENMLDRHPDLDKQSSNSSSSNSTQTDDYITVGNQSKTAVIEVEHEEKKSNFIDGCEGDSHIPAVNIRVTPRDLKSNNSSHGGKDDMTNVNTDSASVAVQL